MGTLFYAAFGLVAFIAVYIGCLQLAYHWFKVDHRTKQREETNRLLKKIAGE